MALLEVKDLYKSFESLQVLRGISFSLEQGETLSVIGPSGGGKTTLLRCMNFLGLPDSGSISVNGETLFDSGSGKTLSDADIRRNRLHFGLVFQNFNLFPQYTALENVMLAPRLQAKERSDFRANRKAIYAEIRAKSEELLARVGLADKLDYYPHQLSGGQQQRVAIARAIVNEPEILLLDEPLGALDLKMRKEMQIELKEMHRKLGITFIYVTHDQEEALTMSDTIVVMKDGQIQQIGTPTDIYNEPANAFVADFIGESNIYNGTMIDKNIVRFCNHNFDCVDDVEKNEKVDVVVRPEDVKMTTEDKGMLVGRVVSVVFKGVHYEITAMVGRSEIVIRSTKSRNVGDVIGLKINPDDIHIMKKSFTVNKYDGYITKKNTVVFGDGEFECDVTKLYPGSHLDEEGYLITADGEKLDLTDTDVSVEVDFNAIEISDNADEGGACGHIVSHIYKGDHYQYIVRTEESEEDYVLDTEDLWNENYFVSVKIRPENIRLSLKQEAK